MKSYFLVEQVDWWQSTYRELSRRFGATRLVIPAESPGRRKWITVMRMILHTFRQVWPLWRAMAATEEPVLLVCTTAHYAGMLAGLLARAIGKRPRLYLCNFYIHELGNQPLIKAILRRLMAQDVGMLAQSPNEVDYFRALAPRATIDYYPLCQGEPDDVGEECATADYIFAGGYTNRDYDTLVKAARRLPEQSFVIARAAANLIRETLPGNVQILTDIPRDEFQRLLCSSRLAVVPLRDNVGSSGQMVALSAMQSGRPVIYADYPTVSQYFIDGYSGLAYRPRDERDLATKILTLVRDDAHSARIGAQAHLQWRERFVRGRFEQALIDSIERFAGSPIAVAWPAEA